MLFSNHSPFSLDNDIALLELDTTLDFGPDVAAVCSPNPDDTYEGEQAIIAGWGALSPGGRKFKYLFYTS